jgi:hypothetical protein
MEFADQQGFYECRAHLGCDDVLDVRLTVVGGELRQKLVVGDAGGGVEAGLLLDLGADRERDVARQGEPLQVFGDIKIGLVQRQRFDDRCVFGEPVSTS